MCKLRILIVEDDGAARQLAKHMLMPILEQWPNAEVIEADRMSEAIRLINAMPEFDVVLLDLALHDSTLELTCQERVPQFVKNTALVVVTGHDLDLVRRLIGERHTEIVMLHKQDIVKPRLLIDKIIEAILRRNSDGRKETAKIVDTLKAIASKYATQ